MSQVRENCVDSMKFARPIAAKLARPLQRVQKLYVWHMAVLFVRSLQKYKSKPEC